MNVIIREEPMTLLDEHDNIPIAFAVDRILEVSVPEDGLGGITLREAPVDIPWEKDYDRIKGEGATQWPKRFDTSSWALIAAHAGSSRVGGAVIRLDQSDAAPGYPRVERRFLSLIWEHASLPTGQSGLVRTFSPEGQISSC